MFVIAEYSDSLRNLTDFQTFVIPGFILLFLGKIFLSKILVLII